MLRHFMREEHGPKAQDIAAVYVQMNFDNPGHIFTQHCYKMHVLKL